MTLRTYLETKNGTKVLSTSGADGHIGTALYGTPLVMDDGTLAFIMRERLSYRNLKDNPHAAFMFIEDGPGYNGLRLFLKKVREDDDPGLIARKTRRNLTPEEDRGKGPKHMVYFKVEQILPLVGTEDPGVMH